MFIEKRTFQFWGTALAAAVVALIVVAQYIAFDISLDVQRHYLTDALKTEVERRISGESPANSDWPAAATQDVESVLVRTFVISGATVSLATAALILLGMHALARRIHPVFDHLQESEARYRTMIQSMDEGVVVIDEQGLIRSVNPAAERLFGHSEDDLLGQNVKRLMPAVYAVRHDDYLKKYRETGEKHIIGVGRELHGLRRDGSEFPMQLFVSEMAVGGRRLFTGIVHDISERKKTEAELLEARTRAEQAAASKAQFLANMSHEIRTPMNGVLGMLELLSASELDSAEREYVHMARQSAISLLALIDDILDLSKIEAGRIELECEPTDLHALIEDTAAIGASLALAKDLRLNCYIAPDVPAQAPADPARLRQVLLNLLSNAVKFTDRGEVNLMAELEGTSDTGVVLRFAVEDTGIGIEPANLRNLFDPFTQADSSITRRFGGTGLGLTISRHLVELMGGKIRADSEPGVGSVFSFTACLGRPLPVESEPERPGPDSIRVLVVDNNATALHNLERYLLGFGIAQVDAAQDSDEAIRKYRSARRDGRPFRLALIKHPLPGAAGLVDAIRSSERQAGTRIVAMNPVNVPKTPVKPLQVDGSVVRPPRRRDLLQLLDELGAQLRNASGDSDEGDRASPGGEWEGARVLLAEDNPISMLVCQKMLNSFGIEPVLVADGREAVEWAEQLEFDLVLMDCQMPFMDGYTAARRIRAREQERKSDKTPIVAVTAHAMEGDRDRCMAAGMDDYISKPYRLAEIEDLLRRWLSGAGRVTPV